MTRILSFRAAFRYGRLLVFSNVIGSSRDGKASSNSTASFLSLPGLLSSRSRQNVRVTLDVSVPATMNSVMSALM